MKIDTLLKRRAVVCGLYSSFVLTCFLGGDARATSGLHLFCDFAGCALAGLLLGGCWLALVKLTREYGLPGDGRLFTSRDERQTGVRHRAFVRAYWTLTLLIVVGIVYAMLEQSGAAWLPAPADWKAVLFGLLLISATLPSAMIIWTEPDQLEDTQPVAAARPRVT